MPSRIVREVLLDDLLGHVALRLDELLLLTPTLASIRALLNLLDVELCDPESIVPAMEVPLISLQHLGAKHEFHVKYLTLVYFRLFPVIILFDDFLPLIFTISILLFLI